MAENPNPALNQQLFSEHLRYCDQNVGAGPFRVGANNNLVGAHNGPRNPVDARACQPPCIPPPIPGVGPRRVVTLWKKNYLVSNRINLAAHLDEDLVNPWGIVIYNGQLWVINGTTDTITNYDLFGNKLLGSVTLRDSAHNASHPTGIAINCGVGFSVSSGVQTRPSLIVTATEHGTVHGYNATVDQINSYMILNQQLTGDVTVYKGLTITNNTLYLADFFGRKIDVFSSDYVRLIGFNFIDGDTSDPIPQDFAPNNIVHIGCFLYILWGRKDPNITIHGLREPGAGYISVFNLDGSFVRRFTSRGVLSLPWAMIPAPLECGFPPGSFWVGNHGDGRINAFDCNGRYIGPVLNQNGIPLLIEGLWGLAPNYTNFAEIFFTSAPDENVDGLLGSIVKDRIINF